MWGAAPCSALPTADENAVTESAVTRVYCSSQPRFLQRMSSYTAQSCCLESSKVQATRVLNFLSGGGVVIIAILKLVKGGRMYYSSISVLWHQEVFWGHGWDVALHNLVEGCQPLLLPTFLQWWQV